MCTVLIKYSVSDHWVLICKCLILKLHRRILTNDDMIIWYLAVNINKLLQTWKIFTSMFSKLVWACVTFSGYQHCASTFYTHFHPAPTFYTCKAAHLQPCVNGTDPVLFQCLTREAWWFFSLRFAGLKVSHRNGRNLNPIAKETWFEVSQRATPVWCQRCKRFTRNS